MSQQNQGTSLFSPADAPMKRKRGRPRKDDSQLLGENLPIMHGSDSMKKKKQTVGASSVAVDDLVGQVVSGVIEGSFDAGYLLNVKVGDTDAQLRGVVFLPGRFTPITAVNDVAPNAKMYERKMITIPVQNPQAQHNFVLPSDRTSKQAAQYKMDASGFPDQVPPPLGQSDDQTSLGNQFDSSLTPKFPEKIPPNVAQSDAATVGKNKSDSAMTPLADKLPMNKGPSLGEKAVPQLKLDSGLQNQTALIIAQLKHDKVFEQDQVQQDIINDVEASKELELASATPESVSAPIVDLMPGSENVNLEPEVQHQPLSSDPKPSDLVHAEVKSLKIEYNQTAELTKSESTSSEPIGMGFLMVDPNIEYKQAAFVERKCISTQPIGTDIITQMQNSPRKYTPEDALLELANETIGGDETSFTVGGKASNITSGGGYDTSFPVGEAANITAEGEAAKTVAGGSYSVPMTNLSVMMFGGEAISTEPKLGTEESVLPRVTNSQICSSSAGTNDVDPDLIAGMTNTHLDLSGGLNLSGSG